LGIADKIILGTVQFGLDYGINNRSGKPGAEMVASILDLAFKNHIRLLDTAEAYGDSHEVIGNYHRSSPHKFNVITKFSAGRSDLSKHLEERISRNLEVMNVDNLYGYMFHSYTDFETHYTTFRNEIKDLKEKGLIKKFGVSIYTNNEFEKLLNHDGIDLVQLPFNLLDNNNQRSSLLAKAKEKGIEVHTRSVFLQGLFFKKTDELPQKLAALAPYLQQIHKISDDNHLSINDLSLNYAARQKHIDHVLIGVDTAAQLQQNLDSLQHDLSSDAMSQVDELHVKEAELLNPANWNK
jgi:aryl-alcohol dehydrogenase-like predicted oxidoreductase